MAVIRLAFLQRKNILPMMESSYSKTTKDMKVFTMSSNIFIKFMDPD